MNDAVVTLVSGEELRGCLLYSLEHCIVLSCKHKVVLVSRTSILKIKTVGV